MYLSRQDAMEIVAEINTIIDQSVNIMDPNGIIIGSTDCNRIGMYHEGAKHVVEQRLEELIVHDNQEYIGSLAGTNLPIIVADEIIGVVGVTGPYKEVIKYGQIIKKMTEILVRGKAAEEDHKAARRIRTQFLEEWICLESKNISQTFLDRGYHLGIDLTIPRRIILFSLYDEISHMDQKRWKEVNEAEHDLMQKIETDSSANLVCKLTRCFLCAIADRDNEKMLLFASDCRNVICNKYNVGFAAGIDSSSNNNKSARNSYREAKKALDISLRLHDRQIQFYDELHIELFSEEISVTAKLEFIHKVFKGYTDADIEPAIALLEIFLDESGSIQHTAQKTFMHKNTLQYKLKKIEKRTGYDPRSIRHAGLFYLAIYFYREVQADGKNH